MDGYHIGIHRPSRSTSGSEIAATRPQEEGCMAVITRGFGGRDVTTPISRLVSNVAQLTGPVRA